MEHRQLERFLAVADEKHFTRAAQRLNIVQSGLSASVRALEQDLHAELFVRTTRQVELTAAGKVFYEKARHILAAVTDAREAVNAVMGLSRGILSIGTAQSLGAFVDFPAVLGKFHATHPGIEIHLCQGGAPSLLDKIMSDELDLAIVPLFEPPTGVATTMITCEDMVLICPLDHPFSGRKDILLEELAGEPFIDFQHGFSTRLIVDHAFREANVDRRIALEVADIGTLFDLVAGRLGVALVPEQVALSRVPNYRNSPIGTATIGGPEICWELVLAFAGPDNRSESHKNPAARAFIDLLKDTWGLPAGGL